MNAPVRLALALVLPLCLALLGAAPEGTSEAAPEAKPQAKPFSHKLHVEEQEMPCKSCHDTTKDENLGTLKTKGCGKCHDDGPPPYASPASRELGVKFPHAAHTKTMECSECHQGVLSDAHAAGAPLTEPDRCFGCHQEKKVALPLGACARCHGRDQARVAPVDHDGAWRERHGDKSRLRVFEEHGKTCADCHKPATCTACHLREMPRTHNGLWRVRTHGLAASWDRDRCKTCHETGLCVNCHQDTRPVNHTAGWRARHGLVAGARTNETCNVCHQKAWCDACHAGR